MYHSTISIHALLAESDACITTTTTCTVSFLSTLSLRRATRRPIFFDQAGKISIHALLAESDQLAARDESIMFVFLSTLSLRRATRRCGLQLVALCYFYPRSPCGERLNWLRTAGVEDDISIHALLAESDSERCRMLDLFIVFLSTLSLRRATILFCSLV